jgi:hypothetical protein
MFVLERSSTQAVRGRAAFIVMQSEYCVELDVLNVSQALPLLLAVPAAAPALLLLVLLCHIL